MSKTMQVRDEASDIKKQLLRVYKKSVSTIGSDPLQLDLNLNDTKRSETMIAGGLTMGKKSSVLSEANMTMGKKGSIISDRPAPLATDFKVK